MAKKTACLDETYRQNVQFIQGVINTRVLGEEGYFISYNILCFVSPREEHRPKMLENKVLRMIFVIKREWRKLRKKRRGLYASPNIIRASS